MQNLSLFGSVARGEAAPGSDADIVVRVGPGFSGGGFDHFGKLDELRRRSASGVT